MLDRARIMLVAELATSRGFRDADAVDLLEKSLSKSNLKFPEPL